MPQGGLGPAYLPGAPPTEPHPSPVATHLTLASVLQGLREERGLGLDFKSMLGPHTETTLPDPSQVGPGPQQEWEPGKVTAFPRWRTGCGAWRHLVPASWVHTSIHCPRQPVMMAAAGHLLMRTLHVCLYSQPQRRRVAEPCRDGVPSSPDSDIQGSWGWWTEGVLSELPRRSRGG